MSLPNKFSGFFANPYLNLSLPEYEMVLVPFLHEQDWLCVCFDMRRKKAKTFHTQHPFLEPPLLPNHLLSLSKDLLNGLAIAVGSQFERNIFPLDDWSHGIFGWDGPISSNWFNGFLVALFALYFDGNNIDADIDYQVTDDRFKWTVCRLLLDRPQNPVCWESFALTRRH